MKYAACLQAALWRLWSRANSTGSGWPEDKGFLDTQSDAQ